MLVWTTSLGKFVAAGMDPLQRPVWLATSRGLSAEGAIWPDFLRFTDESYLNYEFDGRMTDEELTEKFGPKIKGIMYESNMRYENPATFRSPPS